MFFLKTWLSISLCLFLFACAEKKSQKALAPEIKVLPIKVAPIKWGNRDFKTATSQTLVPVDINFLLPENFECRYAGSLEMGTFWGSPKDLDASLKKGRFEPRKIKQGVFQIFVSMTTGYDAGKNKFTLEDDMLKSMEKTGFKNISLQRGSIAAFPVWTQRAKKDSTDVYACHIATMNASNVITILFHAPVKAKGNEEALWEKVISSITRSLYEKKDIDGSDARSLVKKILQKAETKKDRIFNYTITHLLGPATATLRPKIYIDAVAKETPEGLIRLFSTFTASNRLVVKTKAHGSHVTLYAQPWFFTDSEVNLSVDGGRVKTTISSGGKRNVFPEMSLKDLSDKNPFVFSMLSGEPLLAAESQQHFLKELFQLYDIKKASDVKLIAVANKEKFEKYMKTKGKSLNRQGLDVVNEMLKRYAQFELHVDKKSTTVKSIHFVGKNLAQVYTIDIVIKVQ